MTVTPVHFVPPPKILVLLASYNGIAWIEEQLASLLAQQAVQVDLLIGDDASGDGTAALLTALVTAHCNVRVCGWDTSSGSAGANFRRMYVAADLAGYDFVALADQDDLWLPNKLARAVEALRTSGADGYSCAVNAFWPNGRAKVLTQTGKVRAADFLFEGAGQGCTFVVRTALFAKVQQFCRAQPAQAATLHYHDWLIYLLARVWGYRWHFDTTPMIHYRQHGGNEIGSRSGLSAIGKRLDMIKNGWYLAQVRAAGVLYCTAGGADRRVLEVVAAVEPGRSAWKRLLLLGRVVRDGRRRLSDRAVLALAVIVGWL